MKLQEAFDQCMQAHWKGTPGETTAQINGQAALDFFGATSSLKSINSRLVQRYVSFLADKGNAPATINRKLVCLSTMLRMAMRHGELATLPHFPHQKTPVGRLRWLTEEEEKQVLNYFRDRRMFDHAQAVEVLVDTGLRPSELWRMKHADNKAGLLMVAQTKNDLPRCIPLTQRVQFILQRRSVSHAEEVGPFPYCNRWMEHAWDQAKRTLGLAADKEFLVYTLRHTCASRLLQRNVPLHVVSQWLGHRDLKTTMRYAHLSTANLQAARNVLEVL